MSRIAELYDCCALARLRDVCLHACAACIFPLKKRRMAGRGWMLMWITAFEILCRPHRAAQPPAATPPQGGYQGMLGTAALPQCKAAAATAYVQSNACAWHCTHLSRQAHCKCNFRVHIFKASTNSTRQVRMKPKPSHQQHP